MIKKIIIEALHECFESESGRKLIVKAVRTAMIYDLELEIHHKDDTIEKVKRKGDILGYIAKWIKSSEGAIRGCQQDTEKAVNGMNSLRKGLLKAIEYRNQKLIGTK